jgi:hypothetical protein
LAREGVKVEPGSAADTFAGWTAGAHDLIPILPRGTALFDGIPAPAIVIEALEPVIGDGALVSRRSGSAGVILIKEASIFEVYAFEGGKRLEGQKALQLISTWTDATMSAYQLDRTVVAVAPSLYRGTSGPTGRACWPTSAAVMGYSSSSWTRRWAGGSP